jgi:hypothetical protein
MKFFKTVKEMWVDPNKFLDWKYNSHVLIGTIIVLLLIAAFI